MDVLGTRIDPRSDAYRENADGMAALLATLDELTAEANAGGGDRYVERHRRRGRLLPRERIELLVDRDSALLELSVLTANGTEYAVGGSGVSAIGVVNGVECAISASDPTVKGGAVNPYGLRKSLRLMEIARENRLPLINLTESAGADLPRQAEIFVPGGESFKNLTQLSKAGIPTIALVFGPSTAGGAYVPGMSDYSVMVEGQARVYLGGPPLVKMATGEDAEEEPLGGAAMHSTTSGVSDYLAADELDAIRIGRQIVGHLNWRKRGPEPRGPGDPPVHDPEELIGIGSTDVKVPFDVTEVIARVVDGSRFEAFKPRYGPQLICGWAEIHGYPVGILGNNGILFGPEAQKGSQFIQLCNQTDTPLVFLQNITGFMVGTAYEQGGIIKDGAKLINAVANSEVPHLTVMIGASYGAGNYGMCGRAYDPRFLFTWPNHRIAVMGPAQLAGVMRIVMEQRMAAQGQEVDPAVADQMTQAFQDEIESQSTALYATARLWDDGIIDPRETRTVLGIALSAAHSAPVAGARGYGVFRH
ncbi:acyl-CoA carboxylase subunit beta [Euzebya sp.]|uniref:acyl-CoA carboxylase subunit beta n=1 Tax=Euzebya sp. TaxID=1971409 RepID=UPI00351923F9